MTFLKTKIFSSILSSILVFSMGSASLAETKWSNSSKKGGWKEFIPKIGKADFDSNQIVGCGSPKNNFTILFDGTPELPVCQIGVKEPYRKTKRDIEFSEYDIHGTMRTKCADALEKLPQDIFVPSPTEINGWCPYIHPRSNELKVGKPNNFIRELKSLATSAGNSKIPKVNALAKSALNFGTQDLLWRKGFSGLFPNHATDKQPSYGEKEWNMAENIREQQSKLISAYLFSGQNYQNDLINVIETTLNTYRSNNAFEYLFNTPFSQHIKKRSADGGEGELFDDYDVPGFWDNSATLGLNYYLPGIITLYSILKHEKPEAKNIAQIREYVQKLVWLNEQGIDYGTINKNNPMTPESAKMTSMTMKPMMYTIVFVIGIFTWIGYSVEEFRVTYVSLPWRPTWGFEDRFMFIFPAWVAIYIMLSAPFGRIIDRHIKIFRLSRHRLVLDGDKIPEPLLHLLEDKRPMEGRARSQRSNHNSRTKKRSPPRRPNKTRAIKSSVNICPTCGNEDALKTSRGSMRCRVCLEEWR